MSTTTPERVLVIPAAVAEQLAPGLFAPTARNIEPVEALIMKRHTFRDRAETETNFEFKQVIPYVVVACPKPGGPSFLLTQRTTRQAEARLHNKFSIGQGGHINHLDMRGPRPILNGLNREIAEEFKLDEIIDCQPLGLINDNSTEVGKVHLGLAYLVRVGTPSLEVLETGLHVARWVAFNELGAFYPRMESWSQILMTHCLPALVARL
jgi:predicted NUDIX family phosphoesterase